MSFRLKTILGIALIEAALLGLLLWGGLRFLSSTAESEFDQRTEATLRAFSVASKDALISSDLAALTALTTEMLRYPGVVYARVRDADGRVASEAGDPAALQRTASADGKARAPDEAMFDAVATVSEAGVAFGRIEVGVSALDLQTKRADARRYGVALALVEMALVALFSWVLGSYLTRQLTDLSNASARLAAGELGAQIPVRGADELAATAASFNRMSSRLSDTYTELARREAYLRQVLNATHDGIIVIDERGTIESINAGAEKMFGRGGDEVIGKNVSIIVPEPHQRLHDAYLRRYLETGENRIMGVEREFEARRKDGGVLWIALRVAELQFAGQRRFIGVVHDITERKLAERELREAKEAAEAAASAKSDFLANMSHEIRTPMHGVLGSIEMLRETELTGAQKRHLETATTSATILLGVIDEILDFSRLEAGKLRIESLDYDLRQTVEGVTAMLAQRAHFKRVELACYIAPEVPELVRGDPIRVRQVLVNLIGNAIKFTERGEVEVTVAVATDGVAGPTLRFEVRDTGIGIAADRQARLFEPFTQADSSTSRRFGGSGLGLSIARRLVELMDGRIGFDSKEGAGSTFWFTLPLLLPDGARRARQAPAFAGSRVLVVDDNSTNRIILHRYLTAWGCQSNSAASGEEALAKLEDAALAACPYDVALLDLNMPGMDGYTLVARIQTDPALRAMPLIMLSSSVQDPQRMAGLHVDVWLDKPVRQSDLHDAIATVLHAQRPGRPQPAGAPKHLPMFAGERVLLVEDNSVTSDVGLEMLRKRGLTVQLATDGAAAVEAVQRADFDVVLMDIQMPGMDGFAATREIRAWEAATSRRRLPIIALTAHALPADREKCLAGGMDDYVVKPYSSMTLSTVIARWLPSPGNDRQHPNGAAALDPARLAEVRGAMGDGLDDLLAKVCDALRSQLSLLGEACALGDGAAAREVAHRMKNTAGDVGARRLHEVAAKVEAGLVANPTDVPALDQLTQLCDATVAAIKREMEAQ